MLRTESSVCYCLICLCKINYLLQTLYPYCSQLSSKCFRWEPLWDSPGGSAGKEPTCQSRRCKRCRFDPWVGKIPWRREWQPPPVFLPGESCGQRSLVGCSRWVADESNTTECKCPRSLCTIGRDVRWHSHCGKHYGSSPSN